MRKNPTVGHAAHRPTHRQPTARQPQRPQHPPPYLRPPQAPAVGEKNRMYWSSCGYHKNVFSSTSGMAYHVGVSSIAAPSMRTRQNHCATTPFSPPGSLDVPEAADKHPHTYHVFMLRSPYSSSAPQNHPHGYNPRQPLLMAIRVRMLALFDGFVSPCSSTMTIDVLARSRFTPAMHHKLTF